MKIDLGQQNYLYTLLQRKNSASTLLNPTFWDKVAKLEQSPYKRLLALLFDGQVEEVEKEINEL